MFGVLILSPVWMCLDEHLDEPLLLSSNLPSCATAMRPTRDRLRFEKELLQPLHRGFANAEAISELMRRQLVPLPRPDDRPPQVFG